MGCNDDDPCSDFFKAFLHSLRSSCFQFIDFRDRVSVRGFMVVDVDGDKQQHYVLSELVSRGKENGMLSFPLEGFKPTNPNTEVSMQPNSRAGSVCQRFKLEDFVAARDAAQNQSRRTPQKPDVDKISRKGLKKMKTKPPRPDKVSSMRDSPSNCTFTMLPINENNSTRNYLSQAKKDKNAVSVTARSSNTTVDLSSSKSHLHTNNSPIRRNRRNSNRINHRLTHVIKPNVCAFETKPSKRKRSRNLSYPSSNDSIYSIPTSLASESSCEDNIAATYPARFISHRNEKNDNKKLHIQERKDDNSKTKATLFSNPLFVKKLGSDDSPENYDFSPLLAVYESEQECSISAVKPNYLVAHADDMTINETNSWLCEQNNLNKTISCNAKDKEYNEKTKLLLTEENIIKCRKNPRL